MSERVLGMPIKKVRIRTEAALLVNPDYRGVRLDVYADDDEESVYDVEDASQAAEQKNDSLIQRIETRIADIKQNREMEVRYMLFSEMLSDERKEGREEGWKEGWEKGQEKTRESLFKLMDLMEAGGDEDKISLIRKSPDLLEAMCKKYHIET